MTIRAAINNYVGRDSRRNSKN